MQPIRRTRPLRATALAVASSLLLSAAPAGALDVSNPGQFAWTDPPANLPPGGKLVVLHGDPAKPGPFVLRVRVPAGYTVPLHWHSKPESLTVLSGTLQLTTRDDGTHVHVVQPGGFHHVPADVRHVAYAKSASEFQVHGEGPFDIHYVDPRDDPQRMTKQ